MSTQFSLNKADILKWGENTAIFLAPALLVFLITLQTGGSLESAANVLYLWFLNTCIDLLKKFIAGKPPTV